MLEWNGCTQYGPRPVPHPRKRHQGNRPDHGDANGGRDRLGTLQPLDQHGPDTGLEIARFTADAPGPRKPMVPIEGKYVVIWKLVAGKWMLDVDIWNVNK